MHSRTFRTRQLLAFATLTAIAALAACGGGGGSSGAPVARTTSTPITTAPPSGSGLAPASFAIKIPGSGGSSVSRRTQAVNAATTTVSFTLLKTNAAGVTLSGTPSSFDVSASSPLCTAVTGGGRACTIGINAPIGDDIYSVQTFDVNGNKLGSSAVNLSVLQNVANTASITLGGTIAGVVVTTVAASNGDNRVVLDASGQFGPASVRVVVIGFDNLGNVILTPDTFSSPITIAFDSRLFQEESTLRRPQQVSPAPTLQVSVTYANPNGGPASATTTDVGAPITVTSPNDVVTLTVVAPGPAAIKDMGLIGVVGSVPATLPDFIATPAPGLAGPISGVAFLVEAAVANPTPVPTPTPAPTPVISFSANNGISGFTPSQNFQFPSATSPGTIITITDTTGELPTVGTVTVTASAACAGEFDSPAFPITSAPLSTGQTTFFLETYAHGGGTPAPVPSGPQPTPFPTGGVTCLLTATDNHGASAQLNVFVNNATGLTVQ